MPTDMQVIPKNIFADANNLSIVNVPQNLYKIEALAFFNTKVNVQSFLDCNSLRKIEVGAFAFVERGSLNIPEYIEEIGSGAFYSPM